MFTETLFAFMSNNVRNIIKLIENIVNKVHLRSSENEVEWRAHGISFDTAKPSGITVDMLYAMLNHMRL